MQRSGARRFGWEARGGLIVLASLLALLVGAPAASAAPSNDNFTSPFDLTANVLISQDNSTATVQGGELLGCSDSGFSESNTVWYRFKGTGGRITVTTEGSNFDTVLAIVRDVGDPTNPSNGNGCQDDDTANSTSTSRVTFDSINGQSYLAQVGGCTGDASCGAATGTIQLMDLTNDFRATPEEIVGSSLIRANVGATTEGAESLSCSGASYDKTVWFHYKAPTVGTLSVSASRFTNAIAIFQGASPTPVGCSVGVAAGSPAAPKLSVPVVAGDYYVQVGQIAGQQSDVFSLTADFTENPDRDADGDANATDCAPDDPTRAHSKPEIPGNGIDENCDGVDPPPDTDGDGVPNASDKCPTVNATGRDANRDGCLDPFQFPTGSADAKLRSVLGSRGGVTIELLSVKAPSGAKVVVKRGSTTIFDSTKKVKSKSKKRTQTKKKKTTTKKPSGSPPSGASGPPSYATSAFDPIAVAAKTFTISRLKNQRLRNGSKIKIWITKSGFVGAYIEYRISKGKARRTDRCLPAGSLKPRTKCS